jgi:hypothetical protein
VRAERLTGRTARGRRDVPSFAEVVLFGTARGKTSPLSLVHADQQIGPSCHCRYRHCAWSFTATSFSVSVAIEMTGDYSLMVTNPSGESSNNVTITVVMRRR